MGEEELAHSELGEPERLTLFHGYDPQIERAVPQMPGFRRDGRIGLGRRASLRLGMPVGHRPAGGPTVKRRSSCAGMDAASPSPPYRIAGASYSEARTGTRPGENRGPSVRADSDRELPFKLCLKSYYHDDY